VQVADRERGDLGAPQPDLAIGTPAVGTRCRCDDQRPCGTFQAQLAARLYRRALDCNPSKPAIWVQCGHALKTLGQLVEAGERVSRRACL
jgi:hypothetical protein